ncbi:MAG: LacI family DNA-binding transcriptional regulator [Fimbriimonadaceae bacterium]|nr:LacI family DNA-binding transcriptional regulator [Fimbriimonadaceae bacterium]
MQNDLRSKRKVTIRDVAKAANVSVTTVSFALSGVGRPVKDETRRMILEIADDLGYRPSPLAKSMRGKALGQIGIVLNQGDDDLLVNSYFGRMVLACVVEASLAGLHALVIVRHPGEEDRFLSTVRESRADGYVLAAPRRDDPVVEQLHREQVPMVSIAGPRIGIPRIGLDNRRAMDELAEELRRLGHQRPVYLAGDLDQQDAVDRLTQFRAHAGDDWIRATFADQSELLDAALFELETRLRGPRPPTVVVCANDNLALHVCALIKRMRLTIPDDVSVVGFDDAPSAGIVTPSLTTYRQPVAELGRTGVRHLVSLLNGEATVDLDLSGHWLWRDSVAAAPGSP